jgi:hypothetical protein
MTRRYVYLIAVAMLVAVTTVPIYAQQEYIDELRALANQGIAAAQNDLGVKYATGADHDAREPRGALAVAIQPARERL